MSLFKAHVSFQVSIWPLKNTFHICHQSLSLLSSTSVPVGQNEAHCQKEQLTTMETILWSPCLVISDKLTNSPSCL